MHLKDDGGAYVLGFEVRRLSEGYVGIDWVDRVAAPAMREHLRSLSWPSDLAVPDDGVIHHVDHVLRFDHSGWPFKPEVTPFTFSLLAYPMIAFALLGPRRLFWWRCVILLVGTGFTLLAHSLVESPRMQYVMWADNCSLDPGQAAAHNLLNVQSPVFGLLAVAVSMTLNILAIASTASMWLDGRRQRSARA